MNLQTKEKRKKLGQVFTPPTLVNEMLDKLPPEAFKDSSKTWLDNSCGPIRFHRGSCEFYKVHKSLVVLRITEFLTS